MRAKMIVATAGSAGRVAGNDPVRVGLQDLRKPAVQELSAQGDLVVFELFVEPEGST